MGCGGGSDGSGSGGTAGDRGDAKATPAPLVLAAGSATCAAVRSGPLSCWGATGVLGREVTEFEECGSYETDCVADPEAVPGLSGVVMITMGLLHVCAVKAGQVSCWGSNQYGKLGSDPDDSQSCDQQPCSPTPVAVKGVNDAVEVATGTSATCARRSTGAVQCWGADVYGQLGDGSADAEDCGDGSTCSPSPVEVAGITDAVDLSVGGDQACVVHRDRSVSCWGANLGGTLGTGTGSATCSILGTDLQCAKRPAKVPGLTDVASIAVGMIGICAVLNNGEARCWGSNAFGSVGDGTNTSPDTCKLGELEQPCVTTPAAVKGLSDAVQISVGGAAACARRRSGKVSCWGLNSSGQLGIGTTDGPESCTVQGPPGESENPCSTTPREIPGLMDVTDIAVGFSHACAASGKIVRCWGNNDSGALGIDLHLSSTSCLTNAYSDDQRGPCNPSPVPVRGIPGGQDAPASERPIPPEHGE